MKRILLSAVAVATLACAGLPAANAADAPSIPPATAAELAKAPRMGPWGFDRSGQDLSVRPGDDFYRYVSGAYTDKLVIPSDRVNWGSFVQLRELSDARSRAVIETAAATRNPTGEAAQIGGLYNSFMDEARLETLGAKPLAADMARIKAARTREAMGRLMGQTQGRFGAALFGMYIGQDAKNPNAYALYIGQAGLGLPDRDYYLTDQFKSQKAAYRAYVAQMLTLAGWPDAKVKADQILAMEDRIAAASWSKVQQRDPDANFNPMTLAELSKMAPGFPWGAYLDGAGLKSVNRIIVGEKGAFAPIAAIYAETPIETLQA
jgi:putative endopeptidase